MDQQARHEAMNYFNYNETVTNDDVNEDSGSEVLTFTGLETIEVDEDRTVTVDDIRRFIRDMHDSMSSTHQALPETRPVTTK